MRTKALRNKVRLYVQSANPGRAAIGSLWYNEGACELRYSKGNGTWATFKFPGGSGQGLVGTTQLTGQAQTLGLFPQVFMQDAEPGDVPDGSVWIDKTTGRIKIYG